MHTPPPQRRPRRVWSVGIALLLVTLLLVARFGRAGLRLCTITGPTMGTTYSIKLVVDPAAFGRDDETLLREQIGECLLVVNQRMSTYLPESELSRFNQHTSEAPFPVSEQTLHVIRRALEISDLSDGAFDITVGPIVNAYGFGPDPRRMDGPSEDELAALRERVGYHLIEIDTDARTLRKKHPQVYCDLSAIAKGYGVDQVAETLDDFGLGRYMVEIGGEVRARGLNLDDQPWQIAVEKPDPEGRGILQVLGLRDKAVASSGDYRNFYMRDGKRISHTIDPRTGRPVTHLLASVTVIADDCEWADAWATTLMVLGPDEGYNVAERQGLVALFLRRHEDGTISRKQTPGFAAYLSGTPASAPQDGPNNRGHRSEGVSPS